MDVALNRFEEQPPHAPGRGVEIAVHVLGKEPLHGDAPRGAQVERGATDGR